MAIEKRLGRGLESLLGKGAEEELNSPRSAARKVPISDIKPNPHQPREEFTERDLTDLAESIKSVGILQPLVVRRVGKTYELIAGERRLRAAKIAGLVEVPCVLIATDEEGLGVLSLVENLLREDLNVLDEAEAYQQLIDVFSLTQEQIAERVGRSRPHVANTLRLLSLPELVRAYIASGELTAGHGRALLAIDADDERVVLAQEILARRLSVRETEALVKRAAAALKKLKSGQAPKAPAVSPHAYLIDQLRNRFGTKVALTGGKSKGKIELHYFSEDELMRLAELLLH